MDDNVDNDELENVKRKKKNSGGFQSLGLSEPIYRGIVKMGFRIPTPVQRKSLPIILSGADTVVMARTGSGKTAAFLIPVLERVLSIISGKSSLHSDVKNRSALAVILSPTRELSLQTLKVLRTLGSFCSSIKSIGINGGESMEKQFSLLSSKPDIICATPGRLAHHLGEIPDFTLRNCDIAVFDEADRLFEMGFSMQIRKICSSMPSPESGRQTLLFSATMPKVLVEFTKSGIMGDPQVVRLDNEATVSDELRIGFVTVRSAEKDAALLHLLREVLPQAPTLLHTIYGEGEDSDILNVPDDSSNTGAKSLKSRGRNQKGRVEKHRKPIRDKGKTDSPLGLTLIFAATRHHVDYITTLINNSGITSRATSIYGTMDQEARKINLAAFRSRKYPILVVTDVAARGIDVPLIDHVIHYSFPPSAKLFVHRSGRAARAGRVGYCWGLVDTEELPYMVDLFLFLGRKLSSGRHVSKPSREEDGPEEMSDDDRKEDTYTLSEMTPDMVHFGSIPESVVTEEIENVRRIVESELTGSHDAQTLRSLTKVCENAMKQYRRSRPEASNEGKRRAKEILEGKKEDSGRRIGRGNIPSHPILRSVELAKLLKMGGKGDTSETVNEKIDDFKKREELLKSLSNFRPKETVFEAFATGGGREIGVVSHIDKGRTVRANKKYDSSAALSAMKAMRRQMKLAHDKISVMVVAGTQDEQEPCVETPTQTNLQMLDCMESLNSECNQGAGNALKDDSDGLDGSKVSSSKKRLSKAERKKLKKYPTPLEQYTERTFFDDAKKTKFKRGVDFRDSANYIDNDGFNNSEAATRSRRIEAAMQPSSSGGKDSMSSALRLEEAMLDIVGDENADLVQRHRVNRWDKSKRKYIQTTLGSELSGDSKSKKLRLESGKSVKADKIKLGELYEKWQKKTNKSIGRLGVFDDDDNNFHSIEVAKNMKSTARGEVQMNAIQIKKQREADKQKRLKNMKKGDRRRIEGKYRVERNAKVAEKMRSRSFKGNKSSRRTR